MQFYSKLSLLIVSLFIRLSCQAHVQPHSLFSQHMVLQQGVVLPIWGTAGENEKVTVLFNGKMAATVAIGGKWMVKLPPQKAGGPFTLTIAGTDTVIVEDVLVGEVWLCSGQSNMERQLGPRPPQKPLLNWQSEQQAANYPQVREYFVPHKFSAVALFDIHGKWEVCNPVNVKEWSAVGYFFARDLFQNLHIPIGILFSAYGGTEAEQWTSRAALETNTELRQLIKAYDSTVAAFPSRLLDYKQKAAVLYTTFQKDSTNAQATGNTIPRKPGPPSDPLLGRQPAGLYNGMINPLLPYAIKGVCWYQGENNVDRWQTYPLALSTLIMDWRNAFGVGSFPFLIVQIAPYKTMLPEIREAQLLVSKSVHHTALIVTTDVGDSSDIHPANKQPVGARLALAARALAYHQPLEYSGPMYKSMKIKKDAIELQFTHANGGLQKGSNGLTGFTIAGNNHVFVPATAVLKGKKIIVRSDEVNKPTAVRYGWANVPDASLYNNAGLPASPFRTDIADSVLSGIKTITIRKKAD